jgi:hypothetical protein
MLFVAPLLRLSFIDDEALNSYIDGWIRWNHSTWWSFYTSVVVLWINATGRLIPFNLGSVYLLFHLIHSAFVVKAIQIGLIGLNVGTFALVARRLTSNAVFGALAAACVALTLQIRFPSDPIAGFAPLLPLTVELLLLAILGQLEYQRNQRPLYLVLGVAAFAAAALTYEITYAYLVIFIVLAWFRASDRNQKLIQIAAFTLPIAVLVVANLLLRNAAHMAANNYYALSLSAGSYIRTAWIQIVAGIPLSYPYFLPVHVYDSLNKVILDRPLAGYGLGFAFAVIVYAALSRSTSAGVRLRKGSLALCVAVGVLLWLLAVPMMAASPRWQAELVMGQGYLPAYFEYFGIALIVAAALEMTRERLPTGATTITASVLVGLLTMLTYQTNRPALRGYQPVWTQGRFAVEEAVRDGMFAGVPSGSTVLLDDSYVWDYDVGEPNSNSRYLFYFLSDKKYTVKSFDISADPLCPSALSEGNVCGLRGRGIFAYASDTIALIPGERWTRVMPIEFVAPNADEAPRIYAVSGIVAARGAPVNWFSGLDAVDVVDKKVEGNTIIESVHSCVARPASSFPGGSPIAYGKGFYGEENISRDTFRWSHRQSSLVLAAGPRGARIGASFSVSSFAANAKVAISVDGHTSMVKATPLGTPVVLNIRLAPHTRSVVRFRLIGKPYRSVADPRELAFRIVNAATAVRCGV